MELKDGTWSDFYPAVRAKERAAQKALLPKPLQGTEVSLDPEFIERDIFHIMYDGGFYGIRQAKDMDVEDRPWDDTNDFSGVYDESMPAGLDGRPLDVETTAENEKTQVKCSVNLLNVNEINRWKAKAFFEAWKKPLSKNPYAPQRTLTYIMESKDLDNKSVSGDILVLSSEGKNFNLPVGAFLSALCPDTYKEQSQPEGKDFRPFLPKPTNIDAAHKLLDVLNAMMIDGKLPRIAELNVIVKNVGEIGSVQSAEVQAHFSRAGAKFLAETPTTAPAKEKLGKAKPLSFTEQVTKLIQSENKSEDQLNLLLMGKGIRTKTIGNKTIVYCLPHQFNELMSVRQNMRDILGKTIWIQKAGKGNGLNR